MIENQNIILAHDGHPLTQHLADVGRRTSVAATCFNAGCFGKLTGCLHDLGKAENAFQKRIRGDKDAKKEPHAHHGAALALDKNHWPVAFAVNGHHAGLHNRVDLQQLSNEWLVKGKACAEKLQGEPGWPEIVFEGSLTTLPQWLEELPFNRAKEREEKMRAVD